MKFRWLGNSCIEVIGERHLLIDPNFEVNPEEEIDYILVTHEHKDHFKESANVLPGEILAPRSVIDEYKLSAIEVFAGEKIENIEIVECSCLGSKESVGYLISDELKLLHIGDCVDSPKIKTDIMFVPIFEEYHKEILESIERCEAKFVYPFHFNPKSKLNLATQLVEKIRKAGSKAEIMGLGRWIELKGE
jgi:L-ascorbate metabolism protein UlaG (beta-lactamase superfamily)